MRLPARNGFLALLFLFTSVDVRAQDVLPAPAEAESSEEPAPGEIELASPPDVRIANRIRGIFSRLEGLQDLRVDVDEGVVRLTGTTLTGAQRKRAEEIAGRISGVVAVDNQVQADANINRRAVPLISQARESFWYVLSRLPLLLVAAAAVALFWALGWLLTRVIRLFGRLAPNAFIETLLEQIVRIAFVVIGLVVAMNLLGATALLASILGAAGLLGLAIGFAVRDTIENYIASILLSLRQPFAPGDFVSIEGNEGHVVRLNSRATMLMTLDGNEVRIPNATVYKTIIINYTRMPERRFEFEVGIGAENDLACALALALRTMRGVDGVLSDPKPEVIVASLGEYAVILTVFGWMDQNRSNFLKVKSEAIRNVKEAFDGDGISMPEPIRNYRELKAPEPESGMDEAEEPSRADLAAVSDTSADPVMERKVSEVRNSGDPDLLATDAPRE
ncbi:MAG: mechanosensitive ion channel [Sphingomonas sp.]|nr:mechanosensitive ion channel [Sphingomonas sp.]